MPQLQEFSPAYIQHIVNEMLTPFVRAYFKGDFDSMLCSLRMLSVSVPSEHFEAAEKILKATEKSYIEAAQLAKEKSTSSADEQELLHRMRLEIMLKARQEFQKILDVTGMLRSSYEFFKREL